MLNLRNIFSVCLLSVSFNSNAVYIVVHGTFAEDAQWAQPGGDFFDALEREASQRGHHLISFGWSGDNQHKDRIQGGRSLAKLILSYPAEEEKIIIGHSHAGNVIAMASQFLSSDPSKYIDQHRKSVYKALKEGQEVFPLHEFEKGIRDIQRVKKEFGDANLLDEKPHVINRVYFLATPINETSYKPDMDVIHELYSFYSKGDMVQPVFWTYSRLLSDHPRISNFRLTIEDIGWFGNDNPTHSGMHRPVVAEWILAVPHELKLQRMAGFDAFEFGCNGKIHFTKYGQIHFKIDKKTKEEREQKEAAR